MQLPHNHTLLYTVVHNLVTASELHETGGCLHRSAKLRLEGHLGKRVSATEYTLQLMLHSFAQDGIAAADAAASVLDWRLSCAIICQPQVLRIKKRLAF